MSVVVDKIDLELGRRDRVLSFDLTDQRCSLRIRSRFLSDEHLSKSVLRMTGASTRGARGSVPR